LRPFGYYQPRVELAVESTSRGNRRVNIRVNPGPPVIMENVTVEVSGDGSTDPKFQRIARADGLRVGSRLNHAAYDGIRNDLLRTAATLGYLQARLQTAELRVDPQAQTAAARLHLTTGPRYRFGATKIEQSAIDESLLRRFMRYRQDEPFDANELLRTQFALDDSQYFANVEVGTGEPSEQDLQVPITIKAEANRKNRYSWGAGYGSDTGARGTATWDNRRVNSRGHRLRVEGKAAQEEQSFETRYLVPIGDPAIEKFSLELSARNEERADLDLRTLDIEPSITQVRGSWQRVGAVSLRRTTTITPASPTSPKTRDRDKLIIPSISFAAVPQGYLGEALYTRGTFFELRGSSTSLGSPTNFLQARAEIERIYDLSKKWHVLLRAQVGASWVDNPDDLPGTERYFAGGDRSVRGFAFNDLSPVVDGVRVGARHFMSGTAELEYDLPRNLGIAAFIDAGNAFNNFGDPLAVSVGVGFRWRLPVVTLGIDIAQAVSVPNEQLDADGKKPGPRLHLNFSPKF
jgi:translocation and assembly module TamA